MGSRDPHVALPPSSALSILPRVFLVDVVDKLCFYYFCTLSLTIKFTLCFCHLDKFFTFFFFFTFIIYTMEKKNKTRGDY